MVIQLFSREHRRGYLPKVLRKTVAPFFAGGNVAFRRQVLDEIGLFDETLRTGEDVDICVRTQDTDWEMYFNPDLKIEHFHRETLSKLAKQWFDYGYYHAFLFKKHNPPGIEVLLVNKSPSAHLRYNVLYYQNALPVHAYVFLTSFSLMHGFAAAAALAAPVAPALSLASLAAAAASAYVYFKEDFAGAGSLRKKLDFLRVRYVMNASLVAGGLLGGLKNRFFYLDGTLWKRVDE